MRPFPILIAALALTACSTHRTAEDERDRLRYPTTATGDMIARQARADVDSFCGPLGAERVPRSDVGSTGDGTQRSDYRCRPPEQKKK